ncbi:uncharacterized protein LOC133890371 [Phragmites australis]|uniref:uncharacterized protein LOC133890371 n=1 Tax=Phragmites australis TaxID=29695 RepID=UPI002D772CBA|nr:uncharacterized protein LOC133890371 [Phragmites australis]
MKVMLQAHGLWDAVEFGDTDFKEDRMALETILRTVSQEMIGTLIVKTSSKQAQDTIKLMCVGDNCVHKVSTQQLQMEFKAISFRDKETIDDCAMHLSGLVTNLATLKEMMEEQNMTLTLEEVTGRLKAVEDRLNPEESPAVGRKSSSPRSHELREPPANHVHLDEPRAQVHLGDSDDGDHLEGWYFDTGATNHMAGHHDDFTKLDRGVVGSVHIEDGSMVDIRGCGTIVFARKNGEYKALYSVYFIPRLKNSIICVGQLDEGGSKMLIEDDILRIWDR